MLSKSLLFSCEFQWYLPKINANLLRFQIKLEFLKQELRFGCQSGILNERCKNCLITKLVSNSFSHQFDFGSWVQQKHHELCYKFKEIWNILNLRKITLIDSWIKFLWVTVKILILGMALWKVQNQWMYQYFILTCFELIVWADFVNWRHE